MSKMHIICPNCSGRLVIPEMYLGGQLMKCPLCENTLKTPEFDPEQVKQAELENAERAAAVVEQKNSAYDPEKIAQQGSGLPPVPAFNPIDPVKDVEDKTQRQEIRKRDAEINAASKERYRLESLAKDEAEKERKRIHNEKVAEISAREEKEADLEAAKTAKRTWKREARWKEPSTDPTAVLLGDIATNLDRLAETATAGKLPGEVSPETEKAPSEKAGDVAGAGPSLISAAQPASQAIADEVKALPANLASAIKGLDAGKPDWASRWEHGPTFSTGTPRNLSQQSQDQEWKSRLQGPADLYGATSNLLGASGLSSLSGMMNRARAFSNAWDEFEKVWEHSGLVKAGKVDERLGEIHAREEERRLEADRPAREARERKEAERAEARERKEAEKSRVADEKARQEQRREQEELTHDLDIRRAERALGDDLKNESFSEARRIELDAILDTPQIIPVEPPTEPPEIVPVEPVVERSSQVDVAPLPVPAEPDYHVVISEKDDHKRKEDLPSALFESIPLDTPASPASLPEEPTLPPWEGMSIAEDQHWLSAGPPAEEKVAQTLQEKQARLVEIVRILHGHDSSRVGGAESLVGLSGFAPTPEAIEDLAASLSGVSPAGIAPGVATGTPGGAGEGIGSDTATTDLLREMVSLMREILAKTNQTDDQDELAENRITSGDRGKSMWESNSGDDSLREEARPPRIQKPSHGENSNRPTANSMMDRLKRFARRFFNR